MSTLRNIACIAGSTLLAMLVTGCTRTTIKTQTVAALPTSVAVGTPGSVMLRYPDGLVLRSTFGADVTPSSCSDGGPNGLESCTVDVAADPQANLLLGPVRAASILREAPEMPRQGFVLATPAEIELSLKGYRTAWGPCAQTGISDIDNNNGPVVNERVDINESVGCQLPALRAIDPGAADWRIEPASPMPAGQWRLVATSNADYPIEVVLRTRIRQVHGFVRADSNCALPAALSGTFGIRLVAQSHDAGHRYEFAIDTNLIAAEADHVDVFVRPLGEGRLGDAALSLQTTRSGSVHQLQVPAANDAPNSATSYYRALAVPLAPWGAVRVPDEVVVDPDLGLCQASFSAGVGSVRAGL